jgi:mycofactocin precursor
VNAVTTKGLAMNHGEHTEHAETPGAEDLVVEVLIEEVSIDGMCGVY